MGALFLPFGEENCKCRKNAKMNPWCWIVIESISVCWLVDYIDTDIEIDPDMAVYARVQMCPNRDPRSSDHLCHPPLSF
jgi:hypothetical protein